MQAMCCASCDAALGLQSAEEASTAVLLSAFASLTHSNQDCATIDVEEQLRGLFVGTNRVETGHALMHQWQGQVSAAACDECHACVQGTFGDNSVCNRPKRQPVMGQRWYWSKLWYLCGYLGAGIWYPQRRQHSRQCYSVSTVCLCIDTTDCVADTVRMAFNRTAVP